MRAIQLTPDTEEMIAEAMEIQSDEFKPFVIEMGFTDTDQPFVLAQDIGGVPVFALVDEGFFNESFQFAGEESANEFVEVEAR